MDDISKLSKEVDETRFVIPAASLSQDFYAVIVNLKVAMRISVFSGLLVISHQQPIFTSLKMIDNVLPLSSLGSIWTLKLHHWRHEFLPNAIKYSIGMITIDVLRAWVLSCQKNSPLSKLYWLPLVFEARHVDHVGTERHRRMFADN